MISFKKVGNRADMITAGSLFRPECFLLNNVLLPSKNKCMFFMQKTRWFYEFPVTANTHQKRGLPLMTYMALITTRHHNNRSYRESQLPVLCISLFHSRVDLFLFTTQTIQYTTASMKLVYLRPVIYQHELALMKGKAKFTLIKPMHTLYCSPQY